MSTTFRGDYADSNVDDRKPIADGASTQAEVYGARSDLNFDGERWAPVAQHLGRAMHAFEDFWSHSNWLELAKLAYVRAWKGDQTPTSLQGRAISNSDLKTGTFGKHAQIHALGHKLYALAKGFDGDVAVLLKVYNMQSRSEKLNSPEAKVRHKYVTKSHGTYNLPSVRQAVIGTLNHPEFGGLTLAAEGAGMVYAGLQGYDIKDFITNKEWIAGIEKLALQMIAQGHENSDLDSHGTIAKDQPEEGKGHLGAMTLAIVANRRTFGPLRTIMDMPWQEAQAGVRGVLRMVDRMIKAPSVAHPLWYLVDRAITADLPLKNE